METSEGLADGQIQNDQVNSEHLIYISRLFFAINDQHYKTLPNTLHTDLCSQYMASATFCYGINDIIIAFR